MRDTVGVEAPAKCSHQPDALAKERHNGARGALLRLPLQADMNNAGAALPQFIHEPPHAGVEHFPVVAEGVGKIGDAVGCRVVAEGGAGGGC